MSFDPDKAYNDLPLLPPKAELENKAALTKAVAANKVPAELKGPGDSIPNQGVLINAIVCRKPSCCRGSLPRLATTRYGRPCIRSCDDPI